MSIGWRSIRPWARKFGRYGTRSSFPMIRATRTERVIVLPLASNVSSLYPGEAIVRVRERPARALGDQLRSIDRKRLRNRIGPLSQTEMEEVDEALRITLALFR